jgi:hypothetical protein
MFDAAIIIPAPIKDANVFLYRKAAVDEYQACN